MAAPFASVATALAERYKLIRELGSGGMATVYLAEDLKHHRRVAVKVLRPDLAATLGAERFTREIETAAQFQHPNILPLLDSGQAGGFLYYVMPYVEGESLRDRLAHSGELSIHDAVKVLIEVADALAYAHAHGVVHRDIKPDNVLLSGRHALVMDFGVAKALSDAGGAGSITTTGVALGTPAYMAPEQAAADPHVDHRADIYALGVLGYELIAGGPPFAAPTAAEVLAAQVTKAPQPITARRSACPAALAQVIMKCLEKRPADRFQTADEVLAELEPLATPSGGTTPTAARPAVHRGVGLPWRASLGAGAGLAIVAVAVALMTRSRMLDLSLGRRAQVTLDPGLEIDPALSPDGKLIAYAAGPLGRTRLYVRQLEGGTPVSVVRDSAGFQRLSYWLPDGARLLFLSQRGVELVAALGGVPRLLVADAAALPGPVAPDGRSFVYQLHDSVFVAPLGGGAGRVLLTGSELHSFAWSPDGHSLAYVVGNSQYIDNVALGNHAVCSIWVVPAAGGTPRRITDDRSLNVSPAWAPEARALFFVSNRDGGRDVYAVPITQSGHAAGRATRLTTGANAQAVSVAASGRLLAYSAFTETSNVWSLPVPGALPVSIARAQALTSGNQIIEGFDVSPDGRWLAFDSDRNGVQQIFRMPVAGGEPEQLTTDSTDVFFPTYSPNGREIAFHGFRGGRRQVFVIPATGGPPVQATRGASDERAAAWDPSGRHLVMIRDATTNDAGLDLVTRDSTGAWSDPSRLDVTVQRDGHSLRCKTGGYGRVSPDGRWIATDCGAGNEGVVITSLDGRTTQVLVWNAEGHPFGNVLWSADGRTVYYLAFDATGARSISAVPTTGGTPRVVVRFDDPTRPWHRYGIRVHGGTFYLTIGDLQSDIWVAAIESRR